MFLTKNTWYSKKPMFSMVVEHRILCVCTFTRKHHHFGFLWKRVVGPSIFCAYSSTNSPHLGIFGPVGNPSTSFRVNVKLTLLANRCLSVWVHVLRDLWTLLVLSEQTSRGEHRPLSKKSTSKCFFVKKTIIARNILWFFFSISAAMLVALVAVTADVNVRSRVLIRL